MAPDTKTLPDEIRNLTATIKKPMIIPGDDDSDSLSFDVSALDIPPPAIDHAIYLRHRQWMLQALALAATAGDAGEVPVAAIVVGPDQQIIAAASNRKEQDCDPTAHAEVLALRAAGKQLGNWHLNDCTLYVTLEPCMMCAGAIVQSRLGLLVYGTDDPNAGAVRSVLNLPDSACSNHRLEVLGGILAGSCREQLQRWFQRRRQHSKAKARRLLD